MDLVSGSCDKRNNSREDREEIREATKGNYEISKWRSWSNGSKENNARD